MAGRERPVVFARLHDSRIADNADFGPGWRLSLVEEIVFGGDGATHVDATGAARRFRAGQGGFVPHPPAPDRFGWALEAFDDEAVVRAPDGTERMFERHEGSARFLLRRIVGPGGATELFYRAGLLRRVVGGDGEVFTVSRRRDGRVASVSDLHGRTVEYRYDDIGRLLDVRDIAGHLWWHEYDAENRLTAALDPAGETLLRASYDEQGRVAWLDDGRRHVFEYAPGRTVVEAGGGRRVFEQDAAGATRAHTAPGGVAWRIGFDRRHRVESLALSEAALAPRAPTDAQGPEQGDAQTTWTGTTTFQHDAQDRLVVEDRRPVGGQRREYSYDDAGRLSAIATPEGPVAIRYEPGSVVVAPPAPAPTFEYHTGPSGRIYSVGYGGELIAVDWNDSGQVVAFRAEGHSAEFARDAQGRVAQVRRTGLPDARYQRNALGFVALVEHADGVALRVVRDAAGNVEAVESFDLGGSVRRWRSPAHGAVGSDALREGATLAIGNAAGCGALEEAMQAVFGLPPARPQASHGAIGFGEGTLVPFALDPTHRHVPSLPEALRLFHAAAAFLSSGKATAQLATTTAPPEYWALAAASVPAVALSAGAEEIVVIGTPERNYTGCQTSRCRGCDYWWLYRTREAVCRVRPTYLVNSDGICYTCASDTGGGGGGGGNVVPEEEEDEEEEECDPGEAPTYRHEMPPVQRVPAALSGSAWGRTRVRTSVGNLKCVEVCSGKSGKTYRIDGDALISLRAWATTVVAPIGLCRTGLRQEHNVQRTIAHEQKHLRAYIGAIEAYESRRKDFATKTECEQAAQSMRSAWRKNFARVSREQRCHTAPEFAGEVRYGRSCPGPGRRMEEIASDQTYGSGPVCGAQ